MKKYLSFALNFDDIYLIVMIIYMAQMTSATRVWSFSRYTLLPASIPLFLTLIQVYRHHIKFNNKGFMIIMFSLTLWIILYLFKVLIYNFDIMLWNVTYIYFIILYSYVQARIYGRELFRKYESIVVFIAFIDLLLYLFQILLPSVASNFFTLFDADRGHYHNFLYIYNYNSILVNSDFYGNIIRNSGFSWEPGRYSVLLVFAMCFNIFRRGITFIHNKSIWVLLISLITTFSTTGYFMAFFMYLLFYLKKISIPNILIITLVLVPLGYYLSGLKMIGEKINKQIEITNDIEMFENQLVNATEQTEIHAIDRLPSLLFEIQNIADDPLVGYGDWRNSYFYRKISIFNATTGGLLKVLATYGLLFGLFLYYILFKSSQAIAYSYGSNQKYLVFLLFIMGSISYPLFGVIMFTTFWFYGIFAKKNDVRAL